uniref:BURP domain-containing protein n=1 Tax=Chenopodium quinoa TaxID=63459 RepID=A0A803LH69_CHEQI
MVTSVTQSLGDTHNIRVVSMDGVRTDALMPYKIMGVNQIAEGRSLIACHRLSFPYGVYYCHQPRGATTFSVSLVGSKDGARFDAYAMCHHQTTGWKPEYIAFKVLGEQPGSTVPFFPA